MREHSITEAKCVDNAKNSVQRNNQHITGPYHDRGQLFHGCMDNAFIHGQSVGQLST